MTAQRFCTPATTVAQLMAAVTLTVAAGAAGAADFTVVKVTEPATLGRGDATLPLVRGQMVQPGDVVSAGNHGFAELQLGGGSIGVFTLGDLQVFEARGAAAAQPATAKLKLLAGTVRIDSRASRRGAAQDVRLNIGPLKSRIFGADAWAANTAEGDTLCALTGLVEAQIDGRLERLDTARTCLRIEPDGRPSRFALDDDALVARAVAASQSAPEPPASTAAKQAPIIAGTPMPAGPVAKPAPQPAVKAAAPAQAPVTASAASSEANGTGWTVVVLSLASRDAIEQRARQLASQGLPAATVSASVAGKTMYRVTVGHFATQAEARSYAAGPLATAGLKGWAAPL